METIFSFPPVIDGASKILILGSMPGKVSLEKQQYYAHPRNQFWPLMFDLFGYHPTDNYQEKKQFLLRQGIALWDVIRRCSRRGSLDAAITNIEPNDLTGLLQYYPRIQAVFFNGTKAQQIYRSCISFPAPASRRKEIRLYSTSPACTRSYPEKRSCWSVILDYL